VRLDGLTITVGVAKEKAYSAKREMVTHGDQSHIGVDGAKSRRGRLRNNNQNQGSAVVLKAGRI
jgi:hypothetical protein